MSAVSHALEKQLGGRWADLSIVDPASQAPLRAALASPQAFELDIRLRDDAHGRPVHMRCVSRWNARRREHACVLADTSDLHHQQETADRHLRMLQEMVDALPLVVVQLDTGPQLRCAFASGALLELVTPHVHDAVGRDALSLFGPVLFADLQERLTLSTPGQTVPIAWQIADARGDLRMLEGNLRSLTDSAGQPSGHLIDVLETTADHTTMVELRATQERLRRFVTASSDGIVVHVDQRIEDVNAAACRLLSTRAEDLLRQRLQDLIAPADQQDYEARVDQESHEAHECNLIDPQGRSIAVELIGRTVYRQDRRMRMAILRDVRDRREAQARIRDLVAHLSTQKDRAEAAERAKSLFLSAAGHDLRQPIHALNLFLTGLEAMAQLPRLPADSLKDLLARMRGSLDVLSRLLNALLDVSRLDTNTVVVHLQPVALDALFAEMEDDLLGAAHAKGLRLDVVPPNMWVHTDPVVLRRILDNLVSNAIRYTPRGRVLLAARSRGQSVEIQVWDSGIGIAADQLESIFGEYYQINPERQSAGDLRGLGLGLSIVKRSASLLNGRLKVRSTLGRGSMFSITVPRSEAALVAPTSVRQGGTHAEAELPHGTPRHVLVIDNDDMVLQAMQELLQAWGHRVWCAATPEQAILLAATHADEIDLVLSDYHMGEQIDSTQFIDAVRACFARHVPVHVFTADTSLRVAQEVRMRGMSLIHKPVRHEVLEQVLRQGLP